MMNPIHASSTNDDSVIPGMSLQFPRPTNGNALPTLAEWNQQYIEYVLAHTKGKKTAAARILGINRRTLYRRKKSEPEFRVNFKTNDAENRSAASPQ
jgi:DNA-binding NtrC family response regulator